jgi:site-specific recombinase XerD
MPINAEKVNDINELGTTSPSGGVPPSQPPIRRGVSGESRALAAPRGVSIGQVAPNASLATAFANSRVDVATSFIAQFASTDSQRTMLQGLARCAKALGMPLEGCPWHELRFEHTSFIRGRLLEPGAYARESVSSTLSALRGVLKHAWRLGRMSGEDLQRAIDWPKLPKREAPPAGRELTQVELDALRAYWGAQDGAYGRFLAAVFGLLMGVGLRASEACRMPIGAYDPAAGTVFVLRKGGKKVVMPLGHQEIAAVDAWIVARAGFRRRIKSDALLFRVQSNDWVRPQSAELNVKALEYLCETVATAAGCRRFQPHDLRRTFATRMGRAGVDLRATQWFMSHESPETTARYDMRKAEEYARVRRSVNIWEAPAGGV